jgi:hypothetical protein
LSSKDTVAGTLWSEKILKEFGSNTVGIVCLYSGNLENRWIHFEAGAIAAKIGQALLYPLLIDLRKSDLSPPLSMYHIKTLEKEDIFSIMEMINQNVGDKPLSSEKLRTAFDVWWDKLKPRIEEIKSRKLSAVAPPKTTEREILEEVLDTVRPYNGHHLPIFSRNPLPSIYCPYQAPSPKLKRFSPLLSDRLMPNE